MSNPIAGFLYAIVAPELHRVKFGRSLFKPEGRWKAFRTGSPTELCLHSVTRHEDVVAEEVAVHALLAQARLPIPGSEEWFDMRDAAVHRLLARREVDPPLDPSVVNTLPPVAPSEPVRVSEIKIRRS